MGSPESGVNRMFFTSWDLRRKYLLLMVWVDIWDLRCRGSKKPWERAGGGKS